MFTNKQIIYICEAVVILFFVYYIFSKINTLQVQVNTLNNKTAIIESFLVQKHSRGQEQEQEPEQEPEQEQPKPRPPPSSMSFPNMHERIHVILKNQQHHSENKLEEIEEEEVEEEVEEVKNEEVEEEVEEVKNEEEVEDVKVTDVSRNDLDDEIAKELNELE
jgi:hypothetical protein